MYKCYPVFHPMCAEVVMNGLVLSISDRRCPVDQGPNFHCYGHYHRYCKDDSSCPKGKKCCKQGCSYKCVDAV